MTKAHILAVDDNQLSTKMMGILLKREGYDTTVFNSPLEALKWLKIPGSAPDLIISDINMPEMDGHELLRRIRSDPGKKHIPIILLTAQSDMSQKVAGFKAGADDYLVKPVNSTELLLRIEALLARAQATADEPPPEASTITVFSLKGGTGTTSVAVNLAVALASLWQCDVPLVDLALATGHCALLLDAKPTYTLFHLAEIGGEIDETIVQKLLLKHKSGVRLLPAPDSPVQAERVKPETIDRVWPYLSFAYPMMVVDGGHTLTETTLNALDRSQFIVVPLTPELASLKSAIDLLGIFKQLDYPPERIVPILNYTIDKHRLPTKDMETALKRPLQAAIPNDPATFLKAINTGQPFVMTDPSGTTSLSVAKLAYALSPSSLKNHPAANPPSLLAAVQQRTTTRST